MTLQAIPADRVVTVVIPTFNRAADLHRALAHLACQSAGTPHVIVVDNSSTDHTPAMVQALLPVWEGRLRYIRREPNGPAAARNTGLAEVKTPWVLYLDSDVDIAPDWIERSLAHVSRDPSLGALGGFIVYAFDPTGVNAYGGDLGRMGLAWDVAEGARVDESAEPCLRIWINCSAMLAKTDAVREAGGFDESFFYGYEDSDLGWRLNLLGYRVAVFPDLKAMHNVALDSGPAHPGIVFHYCKNRLRSLLKNAGGANLAVMLAGYAAYTMGDLLVRGPRGAKLRALGWNLAHLRETLRLRAATQRGRTVTDAKVFSHGSRRWLPPTPLGGQRRRFAGSARPPTSAGQHPMADDRI